MRRGRTLPRRQGWMRRVGWSRVSAWSVARANLPGVPARRGAHQYVARALARRDLVASGIEHVEVALARPSSGGGSWRATRPSFEPRESGEVGVYVLILSDANTNSSTTTTTRVLL